MNRRILCAGLLALLWLATACATVSPLATSPKDTKALAGTWEEEWPGQTTKDRYRIDVNGDAIAIMPLVNADKQKTRNIVFQQKQLTFYLDMEDGAVFYDLVLINKDVLSGRARGGRRNFDEPVVWYHVHE
jgi:hypothetical protein